MESPAAIWPPPAPSVPASTAVSACAAMAFLYVALLYSPTVVLRLPPPTSLETFLIRRFACAVVSSAVSATFFALLLGSHDLSTILGALGVRRDRMWQAIAFPLLLTSLLYAGTLVCKLWGWMECGANSRCRISLQERVRSSVTGMRAGVHNILAWRNYVVAPFTEELVFRACMIPLLLCGRFKTYSIIFFSPIFFSLAHLNHFLELYYQQRYSFWKAFVTVVLMAYLLPQYNEKGRDMKGAKSAIKITSNLQTSSPLNTMRRRLNERETAYCFLLCRLTRLPPNIVKPSELGYTVIFGWYAAFLFIRTGNLIPPIVAHIFCNMMGLPVLSSSRTKGVASIAFVLGLVGFLWLLFPATDPDLYNDNQDGCSCWHGYCSWS